MMRSACACACACLPLGTDMTRSSLSESYFNVRLRMNRVEDFEKASKVHLNMTIPEKEVGKKEEKKPAVTSRDQDGNPPAAEAVVEVKDEEAHVTTLPALHGNGAIDHNITAPETMEADATSGDQDSVHETSQPPMLSE